MTIKGLPVRWTEVPESLSLHDLIESMHGTIWFINGLYVGASVTLGADREASPQLNETDKLFELFLNLCSLNNLDNT